MFWETFTNLCDEGCKKPNQVASELGISSGSVTKWKNGALPSSDNLVKLSSYFGVTIDFLLTGRRFAQGLSAEDTELLTLFHSLSEKTQRDFLGAMRLHKELVSAGEQNQGVKEAK